MFHYVPCEKFGGLVWVLFLVFFSSSLLEF